MRFKGGALRLPTDTDRKRHVFRKSDNPSGVKCITKFTTVRPVRYKITIHSCIYTPQASVCLATQVPQCSLENKNGKPCALCSDKIHI